MKDIRKATEDLIKEVLSTESPEKSRDKLMMQIFDRVFRTNLHFMMYEITSNGERKLIVASHLGQPEAVMALSAGMIEGRPVILNTFEYTRAMNSHGRIERKIGIGDLAHSIVYNKAATIAGIMDAGLEDMKTVSYIISPEGDIRTALTQQVMSRFGLPPEWEEQYYDLFSHLITPLHVYMNPQLKNMWPDIKGVRFETSEEEILGIVDQALKYGQLKIPHSDVHGVFNSSWTMKEYMINNNEAMAAKLSEMKPMHTVDEQLDPFIGTMGRMPFPTQAHMIQALLNAFKKEDSLFCSSDMGTGKSIQSIGVAHVLHERRKLNGAKNGMAVLLSAPGITLGKWMTKEILGTIPHAKVTIFKHHTEVLAMYKKIRNGYRIPKGEIHFFLVGIDKVKMDAPPYYAGIWKRIKGEKREHGFHCPDCGALQYKRDKHGWSLLDWEDVSTVKRPFPNLIEEAREKGELLPNGLPKGFNPKWTKSRKFTSCCYSGVTRPTDSNHTCNSMMYRPAVKRRGETRMAPRSNMSRVLKRFNGFFDLYICDEVHKSKGSGSGRGDAFASLVKAAKRNLLLTGTLVNGKSSSIKELLWRTDAKMLLNKGFDHSTSDVEWARQYGKIEQIIQIEEEKSGTVTRQTRRPRQPVEGPGIAPHMTAEYLLHKTGFMELGDLGLPLVELKEIPIFVDMDEEHHFEYQRFHQKLYDLCKRKAAAGSKGAWSRFTPATIMYADRPDLGAFVDQWPGEEIEAPAIPGFHAKERRLVELVKQELSEDRGIVLYNNYTGAYQMDQRILHVLTAHGIKAEILDEPDTDKRAEALQVLEEREVKVIITNMKKVEVGLDLLYWPTIIDYQLTYEVSVFRQSNRRNWRIGQEKECRCYILAYNGTQQMSQFLKVMSGRGHALLTEGRLDKSDLAQFSRDEQSSLASDLAACFATSDVADQWTALAAKDLANVEIVGEANFKQVLAERMEALANETRRLCGTAPVAKLKTKAMPVAEPVDLWKVDDLFDLTLFVAEGLDFLEAQPDSPFFRKEILIEEEVEEVEQLSLFEMAV